MKITSMEQFGKAVDKGYEFEENNTTNRFYQYFDWPSYVCRDVQQFVNGGFIRAKSKPETIELYEYKSTIGRRSLWLTGEEGDLSDTFEATGSTATATINEEDKS